MKNLAISIFACAICLTGCKKEKKSATPTSMATPITTTSNSSTSPLLPLTPLSCNGFLSTEYYIKASPPFPYNTFNAYVFFNKASVMHPAGDFLTVKKVSLNGDSLELLSDINNNKPMYYWKANLTNNVKQTWEVTGDNEIPSFTFIDSLPPPSADFSKIPDTLQISLAILNINNVSNATSAFLLLSAYQQSGQNIQINLGCGNNKSQVAAEDLKKLETSKGLSLFVSIENVMYKNFGGKNFKFSKKLEYDKKIMLIP